MKELQVDPAHTQAPFRQIATQLRDRILAGYLKPGDRLPSEWDIVNATGVSRMTVRQAIQLLRTEGLVHSQHGRGVFVSQPSRHHVFLRELPLCGADHPAEEVPAKQCPRCNDLLIYLIQSKQAEHDRVMALMRALVDEGHATPEALRQVEKLRPSTPG